MPLSAALASAFQHIATVVSDLHEGYFNTTVETFDQEIHFDGRTFHFQKIGYSKSPFFEGISYEINILQPDLGKVETRWPIWVKNPSTSVAVNRKAVVAAIHTIIDDPNTAKVSWTLDASDYADTA